MAERITIRIETGNAAFDEQPATELAWILRQCADKVERMDFEEGQGLRLFDRNGNRVGELHIDGI